jgi:hypothetical protein
MPFKALIHNLRPAQKAKYLKRPAAVAAKPGAAPTPVAAKPLVQRRALCIGINYVGTAYELGGCINDMDNLVAKLVATSVLAPNAVVRMDDNQKGTPLYPTRANILTQLQALRAWALTLPAGTVAEVVVAYSGHGTSVTDRNNDEADRKDEVIVPVDFAYITDDELRAYFASLPPNLFLLFLGDCCYSGTVCDFRYSYQPSGAALAVSTNTKYAETAARCVSITAATDNQTAVDAVLPDPVTSQNERQGALVNAFCALFVPGITYAALLTGIRARIVRQRFSQLTQLSSGKVLPTNASLF